MRKENMDNQDKVLDALIAATLKQPETVDEATIEKYVNSSEKLDPENEKSAQRIKSNLLKIIRGEEPDDSVVSESEVVEEAPGLSFALGRKGGREISPEVKKEIERKRAEFLKKKKKKNE